MGRCQVRANEQWFLPDEKPIICDFIWRQMVTKLYQATYQETTKTARLLRSRYYNKFLFLESNNGPPFIASFH